MVSYLASTILMGLFLVAVVALVRFSDRREYEAPSSREGGLARRAATWVVESPMAWILGFLLLVFVAGGTSVLYVGGILPSPSAATTQLAGTALAAVFALVLVGYLVWGAYATARSRGYQRSGAVAVGAWVVGLLFVVAIAAQLLMG
jgi:cbb3-type cytochrome oxidase subunit 3